MEKSNFVDQIKIFGRSGHGGAGSKHFMRNKLTAMGGPDGGDGGRGAHIIQIEETTLPSSARTSRRKKCKEEM